MKFKFTEEDFWSVDDLAITESNVSGYCANIANQLLENHLSQLHKVYKIKLGGEMWFPVTSKTVDGVSVTHEAILFNEEKK